MKKQIEIQNEINRLNAYIDQVKSSTNHSDDEKVLKIKDAEKRIENEMLELAKLIDVNF
jgi:hypothetical protein